MPKRRMTLYTPSSKRRRFTRQVTKYRMRYRGRYRRRRQNIPRYITPDTKLIKLRYHLAMNVNPSSGATAWLPIAANDVYAPSTGTGAHQPMGFDQVMQLYDRFCVVGAKINVCMAQNVIPSILGIAVRDTNTAESCQDPSGSQPNEGLLERNNTTWKYTNNNGQYSAQVNQKFSTKKFFHLKSVNERAEGSANTIWGDASTSPSAKAYFNVFACPTSQHDDCNYHFRITVSYAVLLSGRKFLGQS